MNRFNKADYVLFLVAMLFGGLLILKSQFGHNIWLDGAFFCTEAALVGGIADWFAVTALFKKPLGFPYHTALIPRKREQLVENCIHMVQREFFSRKSLISRLKKENLLPRIIAWLETEKGHSFLNRIISEILAGSIEKFDTAAKAEEIASKFKASLKNYAIEDITQKLADWLGQNKYDISLFDKAVKEIQLLLAREETRLKIIEAIKSYIDEQSKNPLFALMFMFAKSTDVLNYEEAADVIQSELIKTVSSLQDEDNEMRLCVIGELRSAMGDIRTNEAVLECLSDLRADMLSAVDLKEPIKLFFDRLIASFGASNEAEVSTGRLAEFIDKEVDRLINSLKNNQPLHELAESYIFDLTGRAILQAQALLGIIVKTAMKNLSDEQLNELIYSKVETDLVWIRMNGSIVGAVIGLVMFVLINLMK